MPFNVYVYGILCGEQVNLQKDIWEDWYIIDVESRHTCTPVFYESNELKKAFPGVLNMLVEWILYADFM